MRMTFGSKLKTILARKR
jgi:hypothetical protein